MNGESHSIFQPLLELATPDLYNQNAFRLLELPIEANDRELHRRCDLMEKAFRSKLPIPPGSARILPRVLAPDDHEVSTVAHALSDLERRLAHEFWWFWPLTSGQANADHALRLLTKGDEAGVLVVRKQAAALSSAEGAVARHNLAVFHHVKALDMDMEKNPEKSIPELDDHWKQADHYWAEVQDDEAFWGLLTKRIRHINDPSLTTGAARRLRATLPVALTLIDARLALRAIETSQSGQRHLDRIQQSGRVATDINEGLRLAVAPLRSQIKHLCESAQREGDANPEQADQVVTRLLEQTVKPLSILDAVLPTDHSARQAEHDQVAMAGLLAAIDFGNKTKKWKTCLTLMDRIAPLGVGAAANKRIADNLVIVKRNVEEGLCWFCGENPADDAY